MNIYLVFPSIHYVMQAEELLQSAGIDIDMQPLPRQISSDCGMCLSTTASNLDQVMDCIRPGSLPCSILVYHSSDNQTFKLLLKLGSE